MLRSDGAVATDFQSVVGALDIYTDDFNAVGARAKRGADSAKQALSFVEKWLKIQTAYAKSMDELLSSKPARLQKGGVGTQEAVPELMAAWTAFVSELYSSTQSAKEVAQAVQETIVGKLSLFTDELGPRHDKSIAEGRKSLSELKHQVVDLAQKQRTYRKLSAEVAENIALVAPAYEPADQAEVEEIISLAGQKLAAAVGINITEPVPLPMPHARLSSFDDQGERRPSHADKNGAADGLGGANGAGGAADAPSALDLEAAALGLAPMMDGEESLGGSVSLLSFGASGAGTGRTEGMQTKVLLTKENKTLLDPMSMTPPQKRRFGTKLAAMTSPSVQTLLRDKDRSTKQYKAAIEKATAKYDAVMFSEIPEVLHEIGCNELQRVSYMKHCVGHMVKGLQTHSRRTMQFSKTSAQLDTIVSGRVNQCTMTVPPPPRPAFSDPSNVLVSSPTRTTTAALASPFPPFTTVAAPAAVPPALPPSATAMEPAPLPPVLPAAQHARANVLPPRAERHLSSPYFDASKLTLGGAPPGSSSPVPGHNS